MKTLQEAIRSGVDLEAALDQLGTLLRDESQRNSSDVVELVPDLVTIFARAEDFQLTQHVLRVLINLAADNDANRDILIANTALWQAVKAKLWGYDRCLLFLSQFLHNTGHLKQYMDQFYSMEMHTTLFEYLRCHSDNAELVVEFLADLLEPDRILEDDLFRQNVVEYIQILLQDTQVGDHDDPDDYYLNLSKIVYNVTLFQELPGVKNVNLCEQIVSYIDSHSFSNTFTNRQLFSAVGNITSLTNYNNFPEATHAIERLNNPISNLYVKAAYYLMIGNYIDSREKADQVLQLVGSRFIDGYFSTRFTDLIQFQSIHMVKNLLTTETARQILLNQFEELRWFTKVVKDNKGYYTEIYTTFTAFLQKLIKVGFSQLAIYDYSDYWLDLDDTSIFCALAVHIKETAGDLNEKILAVLFLQDWPAEASAILTRLQAMAIILKSHSGCIAVQFPDQTEFDSKLARQLDALLHIVSQKNENPQFAMILNNSRFVAGLIAQQFPGAPKEVASQIVKLC